MDMARGWRESIQTRRGREVRKVGSEELGHQHFPGVVYLDASKQQTVFNGRMAVLRSTTDLAG